MIPKKSRVLVIGGSGMIGQNLIDQLVNIGVEEIVSIDILPLEKLISPRIVTHLVDVSNREKIPRLITRFEPEYIFHLAAHFANQNSVEHPFSDAETNIIGTINVLESIKQLSNLKKFIYASSSCLYSNSTTMHEEASVYPVETPYAISKFAAELYTKFYSTHFNIPSVSIRIFNTYGPCEYPGMYRNVIPNMISCALKGEPITVTGDGEDSRDFTYVSDTVKLLLMAAGSKYRDGRIFNGGTGIGTKIRDLAQMIIDESGSRSKIVYVERRNWDHVKCRLSNIKRAKQDLGYSPKVSLAVGLRKTIKWLKTNAEI